MPYVMKPNKLFAKDPNGDGYLPQNIITDRTTADMVAEVNTAGATKVSEVNAAGATQVAAVQQKGAETLASIPDDYTALSNEVAGLESTLDYIESHMYGGSTRIAPSVINETKYWFVGSGGITALYNDDGFNASPLIDVSDFEDGTTISVLASVYGIKCTAILDKDMVAIDYVNGNNATEKGYDVTYTKQLVAFTKTSATKYIVASISKTQNTDGVNDFTVYGTAKGIKKDLQDQIDEINEDIEGLPAIQTDVAANKEVLGVAFQSKQITELSGGNGSLYFEFHGNGYFSSGGGYNELSSYKTYKLITKAAGNVWVELTEATDFRLGVWSPDKFWVTSGIAGRYGSQSSDTLPSEESPFAYVAGSMIAFCYRTNATPNFIIHWDDAVIKLSNNAILSDVNIQQVIDNLPEPETNIANTFLYREPARAKTAMKSTSPAFVFEEEPYNFNIPDGATVYGRNRFDIANASFVMNGYSSANAIIKTETGIQVVSTMTNTSSYTYAYYDYTAEFTGKLFFSCEASVDGNIRDLIMGASLNGTTQELVYGTGKLFEIIDVTAGDTVQIRFYTHAGTNSGSTVKYENIMLAYGGMFDYLPFTVNKTYTQTNPVQIVRGAVITFDGTVTYSYVESKKRKMICFGDSITGMFGNNADYPTMITLFSDFEATNAGFSGSRYTDHSSTAYLPFSMNRLADSIYNDDYSLQEASPLVNPESSSYAPLYAEHLNNIKNADWKSMEFVTLFWGTNDYLSSVIIRSADDSATENKQRSNVEDAVGYVITKLLTKYPHLKIIVLTPYWMTKSGVDSNIATDSNGKYLYEFCDCIEDVAESYNLPVMNLYHAVGVNMLNKYYYEKDDAHPTSRLKMILAELIINQAMLG